MLLGGPLAVVYGAEGSLKAAGIGDLRGCGLATWPMEMPRGHLEGLPPPLQATPAADTTAMPPHAGATRMEKSRPARPLYMPVAQAACCSMHFLDAP